MWRESYSVVATVYRSAKRDLRCRVLRSAKNSRGVYRVLLDAWPEPLRGSGGTACDGLMAATVTLYEIF